MAFHGDDPPELARLLSGCQALLSEALAGGFRPYSIDQIHGTIVGLEREAGSGLVNINRAKLTARRGEMDIQGFARALCASDRFPVRIRLGGSCPIRFPSPADDRYPTDDPSRSKGTRRSSSVGLSRPVSPPAPHPLREDAYLSDAS